MKNSEGTKIHNIYLLVPLGENLDSTISQQVRWMINQERSFGKVISQEDEEIAVAIAKAVAWQRSFNEEYHRPGCGPATRESLLYCDALKAAQGYLKELVVTTVFVAHEVA